MQNPNPAVKNQPSLSWGGRLADQFVSSAREMYNLRSLTGIGMLLALSVVLSFFTIEASPTLKIGVGYLVTALLGMLYGPVTGAIAAGTGDIIKYIIKPTGGYFFGFTLTAILGGLVYGMFFYRQQRCTIPRAILAKSTVTLLLNCLLNTFWLTLVTGSQFWGLLPPRAIKNLTALPLEICLLYVALNTFSLVLRRSKLRYH